MMFLFGSFKLWPFIFCALLMVMLSPQIVTASDFGIGARIYGDQLLMKDIVKTPAITLTEETVIKFNYAISQPITYIEMSSDEEIYVSVDFSYEDDLVNGTIRKVVRGAEAGLDKNHEPFQVLIQIYGFNETPHNVEPRYILNRGQQFYDMARAPDARDSGKPQETLSLMNEDIEILENFGEEDDNDNGLDGHPDYHYEEYNDEQLLNSNMNKIIQMGRRQEGDYLLYHADQSSALVTETPTNHTVQFYYIDNNFITCVEFIIVDHYLEHALTSDDYKPPIVSFEKISAHTLKAIVTDQHTSNLFVQMDIYGYEPNDKPVAFQSYLTSDQEAATETTMSDDLENDSIQLPLTAKRRTRVHFQTHHEPEDLSVVDGCNGAVGHLVIGNCLIGLMTSASVALVSRYTL